MAGHVKKSASNFSRIFWRLNANIGPAMSWHPRACNWAFLLQPARTWRRLKRMSSPANWPRNRLLLALPSSDLKRLMPELEQIPCQRGQVLMDADSPLDHVFFPDSGVVSVVAVYADGSVIEMATIGREGCTTVQAVLGAKTSSVRLLVQIPGGATEMSRAAFTRAMESMPSFRRLMFAYAQAFLEQVLVSVACNGAHSLKERLARWLLMMRTAVTTTHCRSLKTCSPKCWASTGQASRMLLESWNMRVSLCAADGKSR